MEKLDQFTRDLVFELSAGYCQCNKYCIKQATDAHHKLPKTKVNLKKFPLFIHSIFNLQALNRDCHLNKILTTINPREAGIYERWLEKFKNETI